MNGAVPLVERKLAFDPEEITVLVDALNEAWARLRASGSECTRPAYASAMQEVVARRIFEAARRGSNDANEIAAEAVNFVAVNYSHQPMRQAS
jgi:hypothetical protein